MEWKWSCYFIVEYNDYNYYWNKLLCNQIIGNCKEQFDKLKIYLKNMNYSKIKGNVKVEDGE